MWAAFHYYLIHKYIENASFVTNVLFGWNIASKILSATVKEKPELSMYLAH